MEWQVITIDQAKELEQLGINETASNSWVMTGSNYQLLKEEDFEQCIYYRAYNLSEIAVLLGYTFIKSNVKEAAYQLIQELKVGSVTAKDCNARLREANNQF